MGEPYWWEVDAEIKRKDAEIERLRAALNHCRQLASRDGPPISMAINILNEIEETAKQALTAPERW